MALLDLQSINVRFGGPYLLDGVSILIEKGERLCLIGRNGAGKSTLMKVINGEIPPDSGQLIRAQGLRTARLSQEIPHDINGTVFEVISSGLGSVVKLLSDYHHVIARLEKEEATESLLSELERIHHELEIKGGWQLNQKIEASISRLKLPADEQFSSLSGGYKRRVLLAKALVSEPDVLLLDEPTNHLDIDSISWLEEFLLSYRGTLFFVTHDRALIRRLATRIIELDRGKLSSWPGNYGTYLERKQAVLDAEASQNALFDKRLAQEEVWIRQGIKARRTRNEGRVRALKEMREERSARRVQGGNIKLTMQNSDLSGKLVIEAEDISFKFNDKPVVNNFSTMIMRGDKVGIIGPNGSGKTTLLKLLLGELQPQSGKVKLGTKLNITYFDQHRAKLEEEKTVQDNVGEGNDTILINGEQRHVIGYLQDFLFTPERARTPVKVLSGGERNRLLLAKLFTKPSNMLVMDEPTNDLDSETLDLLEEMLLDYPGTVLLVSHDRAFLNNVVTSTIVFEGQGELSEYVGGYDDWLRQKKADAKAGKKADSVMKKEAPQKERQKKLSFKELRELESLPQRIEELEAEQANIYNEMADPSFYQKEASAISVIKEKMASIEKELKEAYRKWEDLEALKNQA